MNALTAAIGAFFASFAFGILYNILSLPNLLLAGITGAVGAAAYESALALSMNELSANFYGAIAFSLVAELFAKVRKQPVTLYSVPALIPLVPGGAVYKMMAELLGGNLLTGLNLGLHSLAIAGMLVFGMMLVSSAFMMLSVMKRQVRRTRENGMISFFHDGVPTFTRTHHRSPLFRKTPSDKKSSRLRQPKSRSVMISPRRMIRKPKAIDQNDRKTTE